MISGVSVRYITRTTNVLAVILSLFAIYVARFGTFDVVLVHGGFVTLALVIGLLKLASPPIQQSPTKYDNLISGLHLFVVFAVLWVMWRWVQISNEQQEFFIEIARHDSVLAWGIIGLIGYLTYRLFGIPMACVFGGMLVYALFIAGEDWIKIADRMWFDYDGVFGRPEQVVSTIVLVFIVFGAILQQSGAGEVLLKIAFAATGRLAGGPAHASIAGSALFGTMSGAAVANVVSTGVFTIPIIKRAGFSAKFAGAVEAAASTGGQIMPPVMGVVAFVMADATNIPYLQIVLAALLPAVFYYASLFIVVLIEARKCNIGATPANERDIITAKDWIISSTFWVPLGVIIVVMLAGYTTQYAGFYACVSAFALSLIFFKDFRHPRQWWQALVRAGDTAATLLIIVVSVGVVIGIVNLTGVGNALADSIRAIAGDNLFVALLLVMFGCLVMGMGVPTVTAYLILALIMGPVLENLGIEKIAAHMFMVYFGVLSVVTPPVALAAFAAAPIAETRPLETSFTAVRLAIAGFIIPFMFVYRPDILFIAGFDLWVVAYSILGFLLATWLIATSFAQFDRRPIALWESILRIFVALGLLVTVEWVNGISVIIAVSMLGKHYWPVAQRRKTRTKGDIDHEKIH